MHASAWLQLRDNLGIAERPWRFLVGHSSQVAALHMTSSLFSIRPLTVADVPDVLRIQAQCYGTQYVEGQALFERRLQAVHHCSLAAEANGQVVAYLAAYWSLPGKVTPLHGEFAAYDNAHVLYLHDMAVQADHAGRGIAGQLLQACFAQARNRRVLQAALVAVQDAAAYWQRHGFAPSTLEDAVQQGHLRSYGDDAVYMERRGL